MDNDGSWRRPRLFVLPFGPNDEVEGVNADQHSTEHGKVRTWQGNAWQFMAWHRRSGLGKTGQAGSGLIRTLVMGKQYIHGCGA